MLLRRYDVASGQATANQRLIVAAHCRRDPDVTAELEELQEYWREMTGEGEQSATESSWLTGLLPDFPAKRLWSGANARTNADSIRAKQTSPQTYESTDLTALVTLQFILTEDEVWRLEGDVLQDDQPAKSIEVMLVPEGAYANPALTDEIGTFFFDRLEEGNYSLRIMLPQGVMVISDIELTNDEL